MSSKQGSNKDSKQKEQARSGRRNSAEWITLGAGVLILVLLVGSVLYQDWVRGDRPVSLAVTPHLEAVRQSDGRYYLPVEVLNTGDQTAEELRVALTLSAGEQQESSEFSVQFLAGGATANAVVVFSSDPQQGELNVDAISYIEP